MFLGHLVVKSSGKCLNLRMPYNSPPFAVVPVSCYYSDDSGQTFSNVIRKRNGKMYFVGKLVSSLFHLRPSADWVVVPKKMVRLRSLVTSASQGILVPRAHRQKEMWSFNAPANQIPSASPWGSRGHCRLPRAHIWDRHHNT